MRYGSPDYQNLLDLAGYDGGLLFRHVGLRLGDEW